MTIFELRVIKTKFQTLKKNDTITIHDPRYSDLDKQLAVERVNAYCYVVDSLRQLENLYKKQEEGVQEW